MYTVYLITCLVNDKRYVGQTHLTANGRLREHLWSDNKQDHFHLAIRKHGRESFTVDTLAIEETLAAAKKTEMFYIALLGTHNRSVGYNSTLGGESGEIPTEEVRRKIGAASASRRHSPATKAKMRAAHLGEKNHFFGKSHSSQTIEKIKTACRQNSSGESNYWFGKTLSPEHRAKISASKRLDRGSAE